MVNGPQVGPSSIGQGFLAAFRKSQMENDANFLASRRTRSEIERRALEAVDKMDPAFLEEQVRTRGLYTGGLSLQEAIRANPKVASTVLHFARRDASANPDNWSDLNLSDEDIRKTVNDSLRAEYQEQVQILEMLPGDHPVMEFVAGMGGITADIKNLPFLALGGGPGTLGRVFLREAAINTAAETAFLPSQFEMADRLDISDPNVAQQLATAFVAGGAFGVGVEALRRAAGFVMRRDGLDQPVAPDERAAVDRVEDVLTSDSPNPIQAAIDAARTGPRLPDNLSGIRSGEIPQSARAEIAVRSIDAPEADANLLVLADAEPPEFTAPRAATAIPAPSSAAPRLEVTRAVERAVRYDEARTSDPEAFATLEAAEAEKARLRSQIEAAQEGGEVSSILRRLDEQEADALSELSSLKTGGRRRIKKRLKDIRQAREEALDIAKTTEPEEVTELRSQLQEADQAARDIAPRIGAAYRSTAEVATQRIALMADAAPMRGVTPVDGDPSAPPDLTAFDDPTSKEARPVQDAMASDMQTRIEQDGDFMVDMGDGKGERSASAVLEEIETAEAASARLDLCGMMETT